jgi:hypothetical protein
MEPDVENSVTFEVLVKVYLRHREDPILTPTALQLPKGGMLRTPEEVAQFCSDILMDDLDSRSARVVVLGDVLHNKRLFLLEEIQHIAVMAPETLPEGLEEDFDDEHR